MVQSRRMKTARRIAEAKRLASMLALSAVLAAVWPGCGCGGGNSGRADGSVDGQEASVQGDAEPDGRKDALPDAAWPPQGVTYDFCDQPFFKLPIDGQSERSYGVEMWADGVVYQKRARGTEADRRLYYFDLSQCVEYELLGEGNDLMYGHIHDGTIVVPSCRDCTRDPFRGSDLYLIDVETWVLLRLTNDVFGYSAPRFNGRHVVYSQYETLDPTPPPMRLMLWDTVTDWRTELAPLGNMAGYYAISERYVVWSDYMGLPGSVGKDVAYHDLQTGETTVIEASLDRYQYAVDVWDRHVIWAGSDSFVTEPYHLTLYDIDTGEATAVVEGDDIPCFGTIHRNLVAWTTLKYRDPMDTQTRGSDIEMYDIGTGLYRRITTVPSNLGHIRVFHPYLLVIDVLGYHQNRNDWYIAHLERLGVTDGQGNLLPGPPVVDPP